MSRGVRPGWLVFVSARWKAIAALVGSLATALLILAPGSRVLQVIIAIIGALITGGVTHQVSNVGTAPVQKVVDEVLKVVPPVVLPEVARAVTETTTGVLKTATGTVSTVVGDVTGTFTDTVGGVVDLLGGKKSSDTAD